MYLNIVILVGLQKLQLVRLVQVSLVPVAEVSLRVGRSLQERDRVEEEQLMKSEVL